VLAAVMKDRQNHQVGIREKPLFRFRASRFGGARERSEVLVLREAAQVLKADAGQRSNLVLGEEFLARLDPDHFVTPHFL
jgi:hypothetical protein